MEQTKFIEIFAKLRQIIEPLEVEYETKIELKELLDFVLRIYVHEEISQEKKAYNDSKKPIQETKPATEKQVAFIKELGGENLPKDLTSAEASQMIKELKIKSYAKKPSEFI